MSRGEEPAGCLAVILGFLGIRLGRAPVESPDGDEPNEPAELPPAVYRLRDDSLSPAERSFLLVLQAAVGQTAVICPKVNLRDLFFVPQPHQHRTALNRIDRKHVDFVLCDPRTFEPLFAIELDDASHQRRDRAARDELVDYVFKTAGLPLLRIPAAPSYPLATIKQHIGGYRRIRGPDPGFSPPPPPSPDAPPDCPRCHIPMTRRTAGHGPHAGQDFWGCPNFPKCRQTA